MTKITTIHFNVFLRNFKFLKITREIFVIENVKTDAITMF